MPRPFLVADHVKADGVLPRAHGEGAREVGIAELARGLGRPGEPEPIAMGTAFPALALGRERRGDLEELAWLPARLDERDGAGDGEGGD